MTAPDPIEHREARERLEALLSEAREWQARAGERFQRVADEQFDAARVALRYEQALAEFDRAHPLSGIEQEETGT